MELRSAAIRRPQHFKSAIIMRSTRKMRTMLTDIGEESFDDEEMPVPQDHEVPMVDDDSVSDGHSGIEQEGTKQVRIDRFTLDAKSSLPTFVDLNHTQQNRVTRDARKLLSDRNAWTVHQLWKYSVWTIYAIVLAFSMGMSGLAFPDGGNPTCDERNQSKNKSACEMIASLDAGASSLAVLTSFVLGGFLASTRQLWLARRTAYCALCGATRNLLINVCSLAPKQERHVLARWTCLGYELSVLKGRMLIDSDEARVFLTKANLIAENEWETMVNGDRHTTVWFWVQTKARQLRDEGMISEFDLQTVCNAVTLSRDKANDLMSCIDRDQPPPYVFVAGLLVNLNLFFESTTKGADWSVWVNDARAKIWTEPRFYTSVLFLLLYTTMFALLFDVCAVLYNPFGPRDIDVPHETVGRGIRFLAKELASAEQDEENGYPKTMVSEVGYIHADIAKQLSAIDLGHLARGKRNTLLPSFRQQSFRQPVKSANHVRQRRSLWGQTSEN